MFKIGDIVVLNPKTREFGASKGAKAKIINIQNKGIIIVKWIDDKRNNQMDGNYHSLDFELFKKEIKKSGYAKWIEKIEASRNI